MAPTYYQKPELGRAGWTKVHVVIWKAGTNMSEQKKIKNTIMRFRKKETTWTLSQCSIWQMKRPSHWQHMKVRGLGGQTRWINTSSFVQLSYPLRIKTSVDIQYTSIRYLSLHYVFTHQGKCNLSRQGIVMFLSPNKHFRLGYTFSRPLGCVDNVMW